MNFNYFITEAVFGYVLDAVDMIATHGWRLLPRYRFDPATGMWHHEDGQPEPLMSLDDVWYVGGEMAFTSHRHWAPESALAGYLDEAGDASWRRRRCRVMRAGRRRRGLRAAAMVLAA